MGAPYSREPVRSRDMDVTESTEVDLEEDSSDEALVALALSGSQQAAHTLIERYQNWVYNLALRMLWNRDDAADATQEIFLKMVTRLSTFEHRSAFKTWLYRLATNHLLMWKRKSKAECAITGFDCYAACLSTMPDNDASSDSPEFAMLVEEARIGCMLGMLLCLTREQRLVYLFGEIFELGDRLGGEILGITPDNFRQRLRRTRSQLHAFLRGNCGLVDPANPCRCERKTAGFIRAGIVDPERMQFVPSSVAEAKRVAREESRSMTAIVAKGIGHLYRCHPTWPSPDMAAVFRKLTQR